MFRTRMVDQDARASRHAQWFCLLRARAPLKVEVFDKVGEQRWEEAAGSDFADTSASAWYVIRFRYPRRHGRIAADDAFAPSAAILARSPLWSDPPGAGGSIRRR